MTGEYAALRSLQVSDGYKVLQALWAHQGARIMDGMQKAAAKGQESAWRYWAGQMKGFDLAISQVERALKDMERIEENQGQKTNVEELLDSIRKQGTQGDEKP